MQESKFLEKLLGMGRKIIPKKLFRAAQPIYHYILALLGAIIYRFPGKNLKVIGVTGTKGKSTTTEIVNAILEAAGKKTALANTIRYKIGDKEWRNLFKMTLRGRFFTQRFLRQALESSCEYAIIEVSSEGVPQSRHKFLFLDALIFTNLAPEHIESHGSYENYVEAKLSIAREMAPESALIVNVDDSEAEKFLSLNIKNTIPYSLKEAINVRADEKGSSFQIGKTVIYSKLPGIFNIYNALGAAALAKYLSIKEEVIKSAIESMEKVRGRGERIECGQEFDVVVDYAHTPDSLRAIYETYSKKKMICVLGNTGGGRDTWKRRVMGELADEYCSEIILTEEDPYDEDPDKIVSDIKAGINKKPVEIIMDRRTAIASAIAKAKPGSAVLITGKGTDPYIMGPRGNKTPWDDAEVAKQELRRIMNQES